MAVPNSTVGDSQLWGTIGTWAVGILASVIAAMQYLNTRFSPRVSAVFGPVQTNGSATRFVVTVRNKGGATGMVARVAVVGNARHTYELKVTYPEWTNRPPFPFMLAGHAAAIIVIDLAEKLSPAARILVSYDGKKERCTRFKITKSVLSENQTALPPDSLAMLRPP